MRINEQAVRKLVVHSGMTQNQFARKIGISHGAFSNALAGRRGAGRKLLAGLLRLFPNESVASLTVSKGSDAG